MDPITQQVINAAQIGTGEKKKKKKKSSSLNYLPSTSGFPVAVSSPESFKKLLSQLGSVQKTKLGLAALGKDPNSKPREGLLSKLFGQEKGILTIPFRFVSALTSDVLGLDVKDEEAKAALEQYNPIEAAFRSAKGEFAVTGGDIFKTNDEDSFLERLGKYAGALAFDITLDPINWFGGYGIIGRKGASVVISRQGEKLIPALTNAMAEEGLNATKIIDDLFNTSKAFQVAKAGDQNLIAKLGIVDGVVTNQAQKVSVAGQELAGFLAEKFYIGGRSGMRKALVDLTGSEKVADKIFKILPDDISGGLFVKNPITGKPFSISTASGQNKAVRLAGGTGKVIPGLEVPTQIANKLRFGIASSTPGRFISEHFSTRIGPAWADVKRGMIGGVVLGKNERTKLYEFTAFKDIMRQNKIDIWNLGNEASGTLSAARGAKQTFTTDIEKQAYENSLISHFNAPDLSVPDDATDAAMVGVDMANRLRAMKDARRQQMVDAGLAIGDMGPDHVPLRYTPEHIKWLQSQGIDVGSESYSMAQGRTREIRYITDPEAAKAAGYSVREHGEVRALTAPELNRMLGTHPAGHKVYIEDPIMIMADYMESTGRTLASKRLSDALIAANVIYKIPDRVVQLMKEKDTAILVSSMQNVSKKTKQYWDAITKRNDKAIEDILDQIEVKGTQVAARYEKAAQDLADAEDTVKLVQQNLTLTNQRIRELRPRVAQIEADFNEAMRFGAVAGPAEEQAAREARNARSRASKARKKAGETAAQVESTAARAAQPIYDPETFKYTDASVARAVLPDLQDEALRAQQKLDIETLTAQSAQRQLNDARALRESVQGQVVGERMQALQEFEEVLADQVQLVQMLDTARELRRVTSREATLALQDTNLARATTIRELVDSYKNSFVNFKKVVAEINKPLKSMNDEELVKYYGAKVQMDMNRDKLKRMLGYSTRKDNKALGPKYYKEVINLLNKVSAEEFNAIRAISSAGELDNLLDQLDNVDFNTHMNVIGDLVATYRNIRRRVSADELKLFDELDADIMSNMQRKQRVKVEDNGMSAIMRSEKKQPKEIAELYSDAGFARIGSGEDKGKLRIPMPLKDAYAAKGVRGVLEDMYKIHDNPSDWLKFVNNLYDPLALVWKTGATAGRGPAFVINNVVGGMVNNFIGGVSAREHAVAAKAVTAMITAAREIRKENPGKLEAELVDLVAERIQRKLGGLSINGKNVADLFSDFLERGGHLGTDTSWQLQELKRLGLETSKPIRRKTGFTTRYTTEATNIGEKGLRKTAAFFLDNWVQRMFNDWSQSSEVFLRFAAFNSGWRKYGDVNSAMDTVFLLHFDYQDMTDAEVWMKRFIPFYTWNRNNIPLQVRAMFIQSDKFAKLYTANEEAKAAFGVDGEASWLNEYMPDWLETQAGWVTDLKIGGNHLALFPKLPIFDVEKFFGVGYIGSLPIVVPRMSEFINLSGPAIKTPTEMLTSRNFDKGYSYGSFQEMLLAQGRNIFPYAGTAKRLASVMGFPVEKEKRISNLINLLVGSPYGAATYTEKTLMGEAWKDSATLAAQLKKASVEAGVDYEWLTKQISQGKNLNQIVAMIGSGQGSIERQARQKKIKEYQDKMQGKNQDKRNYREILQGLQTGQLMTGF